MRVLPVLSLILSLCAMPLPAQDAPDSVAPGEEGSRSLMEEGARLFFRGIMTELEPALRDLEGLAGELEPAVRDFAQQMGPALRDLLREVEDWSAYAPPEILPNGDIIIRRRRDEDPQAPAEPGAEGAPGAGVEL